MVIKIISLLISFGIVTVWAMPPLPGVKIPKEVLAKRHALGIDIPSDPVRDAGKKGMFNSIETGFITLVSGTKNFPVVLMKYADLDSTYPKNDFQTMLFGTWPSGTATDYYKEISYNQLTLAGTVYGWFSADSNKAHYGMSTGDPASLIREAALKSDPVVNYADFDNNADGFVDCFTVVHAGKGMEETGDGEDIWSHMSSLQPFITTNDPDPHHPGQYIKISLYTVDPERSGVSNNGEMCCIGVFCHEWGHALGLPDLYDTDGGGSGLGLWCLMAGGSWGGDWSSPWSPTHLSVWGKMDMGWLSPTVVTSANTYELKQIEDNPAAYKLPAGGTPAKEYFLIENRQKIKFDQRLLGSGFFIYHIDENIIAARRNYNLVNAGGGPPYGVALEQADGQDALYSGTDAGNAGDPFPGATNNTGFDSAFTNPNSHSNSGAYTSCGVNTISNSALPMSAYMYVGSGVTTRYAYADHNIGSCILTVTENGAIGFLNSDRSNGTGFKYTKSSENWLYYASLAVGSSVNYLVDNYYGPSGRNDGDFLVSTNPDGRLRFIQPPERSDQEIVGFYDDRGHPAPKGLSVKQRSMAYSNTVYNDCVILEYTFKNNDSLPLNGLYAAEFADFDMTDAGANNGGIDDSARLAYVWRVANTNPHIGIKLLAPTTAKNVSVFDNATFVYPSGGMSDNAQFQFMNGVNKIAALADTDVSVIVSAGPFDLGPADSTVVAFAFVGGSSLARLLENGDSAEAIYLRESSVAEEPPVSTNFFCELRPCSPSPFHNQTVIQYQVSGTTANPSLRIYDLTGRAVRDFTKVLNPKPGLYTLLWDGRDDAGRKVPAGVYFCKLQVLEKTVIQKAIRVR